MNRTLYDCVSDYTASEHFLFLDDALKEHAEDLLAFWCEDVGEDTSPENLERALKAVAHLDVPPEARRAFPDTLRAFVDFVVSTGSMPDADEIADRVGALAERHAAAIRDDGTVRGETVRQSLKPPGRNDPCPCGSGKKYKKCCNGLFG